MNKTTATFAAFAEIFTPLPSVAAALRMFTVASDLAAYGKSFVYARTAAQRAHDEPSLGTDTYRNRFSTQGHGF